MPQLVRPGFMNTRSMTDISGQPYRMGASQIFASGPSGDYLSGDSLKAALGASSASSSGSSGGSSAGSLPASIAPPDLKPFQYSADSQSYPTFLRNLGENAAQQAFQREINAAGPGNSVQSLIHAQDRLNNARLGYMSQAGQEELGVQNALAGNQNSYNQLLAQLYGIQVGQRGQDVGYNESLNRNATALQSSLNAGGGGVMRLGGGNSQLMNTGGDGSYRSLTGQNYYDSQTSIPSSGGWH